MYPGKCARLCAPWQVAGSNLLSPPSLFSRRTDVIFRAWMSRGAYLLALGVLVCQHRRWTSVLIAAAPLSETEERFASPLRQHETAASLSLSLSHAGRSVSTGAEKLHHAINLCGRAWVTRCGCQMEPPRVQSRYSGARGGKKKRMPSKFRCFSTGPAVETYFLIPRGKYPSQLFQTRWCGCAGSLIFFPPLLSS